MPVLELVFSSPKVYGFFECFTLRMIFFYDVDFCVNGSMLCVILGRINRSNVCFLYLIEVNKMNKIFIHMIMILLKTFGKP